MSAFADQCIISAFILKVKNFMKLFSKIIGIFLAFNQKLSDISFILVYNRLILKIYKRCYYGTENCRFSH